MRLRPSLLQEPLGISWALPETGMDRESKNLCMRVEGLVACKTGMMRAPQQSLQVLFNCTRDSTQLNTSAIMKVATVEIYTTSLFDLTRAGYWCRVWCGRAHRCPSLRPRQAAWTTTSSKWPTLPQLWMNFSSTSRVPAATICPLTVSVALASQRVSCGVVLRIAP